MFEDFFPLCAKTTRSHQQQQDENRPRTATLLLKLTSFVWIILVLINKKCNLTAVFVTQKLSYIALETAAATLIFILLSAKFPLHFDRCSGSSNHQTYNAALRNPTTHHCHCCNNTETVSSHQNHNCHIYCQ